MERDTASDIPCEPLDMSDMDQQMQESFGIGGGDEVEGYSVPASKQKRPSGGSSTRQQRDTKVIEQQMASVTISEDQPMSRTGSSMSMDTQP